MKQLKLAVIFAISINFLLGVPTNLKFNHLTIKDGLSFNKVNDIVQDATGFLWIATSDGLNRYNGYSVEVLKSNQNIVDNINNDDIRKLHISRKNILWIGTFGGGLNKYEFQKQKFEHFSLADSSSFYYEQLDPVKKLSSFNPSNPIDDNHDIYYCYRVTDSVNYGILNNYITDIEEDKHGNIWFGTSGGGLGKYDPNTKRFNHFLVHRDENYNISGADVINSIDFITNDLLLVSSGIGLLYFNINSEEFEYVYEINDAIITVIENDSLGTIWLGTNNKGLYQLNKNFEVINHYTTENSQLEDNFIVSLNSSSSGQLWIGTETTGLYKYSYESGIFRNYKENISDINSINHNSILTIYIDNDEMLWLGTHSGGVNYTNSKGKNFNTITGITQIEESVTIW